jgi:nicotinic acid mononucleotide adenylyltransferase
MCFPNKRHGTRLENYVVQNSEITASSEERIAVTQAAIDESLSMFVVDGEIQIASKSFNTIKHCAINPSD